LAAIEQSLAADGAIAYFSSSLILRGLKTDCAPQLKASVQRLSFLRGAMMKLSICPFVFVAVLALVALPANSENNHGGCSRLSSLEVHSEIREAYRDTSEERKIIEECKLLDRPKPKGEIKVVPELRGRAISKPKPVYPKEAKATKVSGAVKVDVVIDEKGRVIWAEAVTGEPMLQEASRRAACRARYSPTVISSRAVKIQTSIRYNFVLP
jgi:TonB family protein